jgi:hypothetical protein
MIGVFSMRCRAGDGGLALRGRLAGGGHKPPRAAAVKSRGGERRGKSRAFECGRYDPMKANVSEPQMTCRNLLDDIKSGAGILSRDEPGGSLLIGQVVSGMHAARAWVRLLHGTWEPVVSRDGQPVAYSLRLAGHGRIPSGWSREDKSTDARHRGGPARSSDEGPVMGLERRGRAVQARLLVNHEVVGGANG